MTATLLEFQQLQCIRDERILFTGLDLTVAAGDIVHILGPNGTGKTTLLRALTGLFADYQGDIRWQGQSIRHDHWHVHTHMVFIGHLPSIKNTLTPRENLHFLANLQGTYDGKAVDDALEQVGLYGYEETPGYQLSGGQKRRITLARLYLTDASVWVLDEPYTALDAQGVEHLEQQLTRHRQQGGCIVMSSHQAPSIDAVTTLSLLDYLPADGVTDV